MVGLDDCRRRGDPPTPFSVAIGDLNRDGKLDIVTANESTDDVSVLFGTGTGLFGAPAKFNVGITPVSVEIGDLNEDGKPDLVVGNLGGSNVSILLNQ